MKASLMAYIFIISPETIERNCSGLALACGVQEICVCTYCFLSQEFPNILMPLAFGLCPAKS